MERKKETSCHLERFVLLLAEAADDDALLAFEADALDGARLGVGPVEAARRVVDGQAGRVQHVVVDEDAPRRAVHARRFDARAQAQIRPEHGTGERVDDDVLRLVEFGGDQVAPQSAVERDGAEQLLRRVDEEDVEAEPVDGQAARVVQTRQDRLDASRTVAALTPLPARQQRVHRAVHVLQHQTITTTTKMRPDRSVSFNYDGVTIPLAKKN